MIRKNEFGSVYRVYLSDSTDGQIGKYMIKTDERIVILENGLVYAYERDATLRTLYTDIDSYRKYRECEYLEPEPPGGKFIGLKDLYYKESIAYSDLLFSLCNSYDYYAVKELYSLIESINQLYDLIDDDELSDYNADDD